VPKAFSYLDDALIQEDLRNVNQLANDARPQITISFKKECENFDQFSPRSRVKIKQDLNETFKASFHGIQMKNYDLYLAL